MNKSNFISANKCEIGKVYYLSGMVYSWNKPLINTPVKFIGKDTNSNVGLSWDDCKGKHMFEFVDEPGRIMYSYADSDMLIEPIKDPEILRVKIPV